MKNTGFKCPQPERCETHSLSQILMLTTLLFTFFSCVGSTSAGAANFALQYDGSDDFAKVLNVGNFNFSPAFTIEAWVKPASVNSDGTWKAVVSGTTVDPPSGAFGTYGWVMYLPNSDHSLWGMSVCKPGCVSLVVPSLSLKVNEWHHVAATYDGVNIKIYRDGILTNTKAQSGNAIAVNYLFIGTWLSTFNGVIDEVRAWNIARTEQAIASTVTNSLQGDETGLVGYWRFDEGFGQFASDASGNDQAAQLGSTDGVDDQDPVWVTSDWDGSISDAEAPAIGIGFAPLPLGAGEEGTITATADDENTGGSPIMGTEYQLDAGSWLPLPPLDGTYDSMLETGVESVSFPNTGMHQACVRGTDLPGNTSAPICMDIEVIVPEEPPIVLLFSLIPDTDIVQGLLMELEAVASDVNRGDKVIVSAEYRVDEGSWTPMTALDGFFDNELEQIQGFVDTSALEISIHAVCIRATEAGGEMSEEACKNFEVVFVDDPGAFTVQCTHSPIWPQPGDQVSIRVEAWRTPLDDTGTAFSVEQVEIWFNNKTKPLKIDDRGNVWQANVFTDPLTAGSFFYGCRAKRGDKAVFSGWRTVMVGSSTPEEPVPLVLSGPSDSRIDVVFVADDDSYQGSSDPEFIEAIEFMIRAGFYEFGIFNQNQHLFNFWLSWNTGTADGYTSEDGCQLAKPVDWNEKYAFADVAAIIHVDAFRDCATGGAFSSKSNLIKVFRHESGHKPFGLADEYCCDGGYFETNVAPNVYKTLEACETDAPNLGRNPASCRNWVSTRNDKTYYSSEPASDDLMRNNRFPNAADIRRIEWKFQQCGEGEC